MQAEQMLQENKEKGGLKSHRRLCLAFVLTIGLQVLLLIAAFAFSTLGKHQTSRILAFDIAASRIHTEFEQISMALHSFYEELANPNPSRPYVEGMQAHIRTRLTLLEGSIRTLSADSGEDGAPFQTADARSQALLSYVRPQLDAFTQRAQSLVSSDFETLKMRYSQPSIVDLAAARGGLVRRSLAELAENARDRQTHNVDRFYRFIVGAILLSLLLLLLSWRLIIKPALARQKKAILREIDFSADLERKNAALKQAESHALLLYEDAKQGMRARNEFLAVVSHELRTPLNAVIGLSEIMKEEMFGKHEVATYRDYSADIHKSGKHLLSVVSDILEFSRYESQKIVLDEDFVTVPTLLEAARVFIGNKAKQAGVHLDFKGPSCQGDSLRVDQRLVSQALINLLDNAIKFSSEGDAVTIDSRLTPDGDFMIRVTDDGVGIDTMDVARLLEPFEQIESAFSRKAGGLGLGLAIANKIMHSHDGRIDVQSSPGSGSCFGLVFPAARYRRTGEQDAPEACAPESYTADGMAS